MKVAFDEHIPPALVHAFQAFANEWKFRQLTGGLAVEKAKDYAPKPGDEDYLKGNDVPWIRRFAKGGGKIIITGDTEMISVPHERLALLQEPNGDGTCVRDGAQGRCRLSHEGWGRDRDRTMIG